MTRWTRFLVWATFVGPLCGGATRPAGAEAFAVSPGQVDEPSPIAALCPTFSWSPEPYALGYQLAVFETSWTWQASYEEIAALSEPIIAETLPAPALVWTPGSARCLEQGASYVWYVRPIRARSQGPWSPGLQFTVDAMASVAAIEPAIERVVSEYLTGLGDLEGIAELISGYRPPAPVAPGQGDSARIATSRAPSAATEEPAGRAATFGATALRVSSDLGVVFDDPIGDGEIPAVGSGVRFFWYPGKRALRAGSVTGNQWDEANVGFSSTALGADTAASGESSVALGYRTTASGQSSTALGRGTTAESWGETVVGFYNTLAVAPSPAWPIDTDRLFVIGNGNFLEPSDAMVVLKSGNVGIGTSTPDRALTVEGQVAVDGLIRLRESGTDEYHIDYYNGGLNIAETGTGGGDYRLFIADGGNVGIGTSSPSRRLFVSGDAGGATAWHNDSDRRLKTRIEPLDDALTRVLRLRGVSFDWQDTTHHPPGRQIGFIGQEVQAIVPEVVDARSGSVSMQYAPLTALLVEAIKQQQAQIEALRALVCRDRKRAIECR